MATVINNTGWTFDYVEDNLTSSRHKSLIKQWEKCLPVTVAASFMCQYFGVWKPVDRRDIAELADGGLDGL